MDSSIYTIVILIIFLLWVCRKKFNDTFRFIVDVATVVAAVAAVLVLYTPPAQESAVSLTTLPETPQIRLPENKKDKPPVSPTSVAPAPMQARKTIVARSENQEPTQEKMHGNASSTRDASGQFYSDVVPVEANDDGVVFVNGHPDLTKLVQFCPDDWTENCPKDVTIKRQQNSFKLNKQGLARHQTAFNLQDDNGFWFKIDSYVTGSDNVAIRQGKNGKYFEYSRPTP